MDTALAGEDGELVVALNGLDPAVAPEGARVVRFATNRGVAPGWNAAARAASGELLAFGNDDLVLGPGSLRRLAEVLRTVPAAGVVGIEAVDTGMVPLGPMERERPVEGLAPCEAIRGPLFALRREVFEAVSGFDEAYAPCLWEEIDICLAVRAAGLRCFVAEEVKLEHRWGISARRSWPWARVAFDGRSESLRSIRRRNRRRLAEKWG
jgi:GT2 family glycosyltransferase